MKLLEPEKRTAEQQNIEPQNFEGFFTSTFDIHCSIFDILFLSFLLDQTGRSDGQRPAARLYSDSCIFGFYS
jgi:hypothetical protein